MHEVELYKVEEGEEVHASAKPESTELSSVKVVEPSDDSQQALLDSGWRRKRGHVSLEGCNSTIKVPAPDAPWYKQWSAYVGVGFMISVGYALTCWQHTGTPSLPCTEAFAVSTADTWTPATGLLTFRQERPLVIPS